ncbi:HTH_Tnp_Tc3_2 domain-containing protein [Trichonephila clavipes]|nr:HTH_Tnp_Tc3_2 domain-containing protein [Trichonephila clavipes]
MAICKKTFYLQLDILQKTFYFTLSSVNRRVHLTWCENYRDWNMDQWETVTFTDESRFSLTSNSYHAFKWREPGTNNLPLNAREIGHYGSKDLASRNEDSEGWPRTPPFF